MINFDGSDVNFVIAYVAGFVTFFASCLLPLIPSYLGYLAGNIKDDEEKKVRLDVFTQSVWFVVGFVGVFVSLGILSVSAGSLVNQYRVIVNNIGGILLIGMGLFMLGLLKFDFLYREKRLSWLPKTQYKFINSILFGILFGFAWSPCIGPVLAVILFWASQQGQFVEGVGLLLVYGIGLGTPFLILGLLFDYLERIPNFVQRYGGMMQKTGGVMIVIMGVLLLLGKLGEVTIALLRIIGMNSFSL